MHASTAKANKAAPKQISGRLYAIKITCLFKKVGVS